MELALELSSGGGGGSLRNLSAFRLLRVMRIFRIMRIIKTMKVFRDFRILLNSIYGSMKSLAWAMCLMSLIVYLFSVIFTQSVLDHILDEGEPSSGHSDLKRYYGTLFTSMLTLYQTFTDGRNWSEVVEPLWDVHLIFKGSLVYIFIMFISFVFFAVTNVITGVFCENAIATAKRDQDEVIANHMASKSLYCTQLQDLFATIDASGSGDVTINEFEMLMYNEKVMHYFETLDIDATDLWDFFQLLDTDGSHSIDLEEFVGGIMKLKGPAKSIDLARLKQATGKVENLLEVLQHNTMDFNMHLVSDIQSQLSSFLEAVKDTQRKGIQMAVHAASHKDPANGRHANDCNVSDSGVNADEVAKRQVSL